MSCGASTEGAGTNGPKGAVPAVLVGSTGKAEPLAALKGGGGGDVDSGDEGEEVVDCSICMCVVTGEEDAASLDKCVHAFHFACIIKWGETTNQCPMCKVCSRPRFVRRSEWCGVVLTKVPDTALIPVYCCQSRVFPCLFIVKTIPWQRASQVYVFFCETYSEPPVWYAFRLVSTW